jgi:hypothetical protein
MCLKNTKIAVEKHGGPSYTLSLLSFKTAATKKNHAPMHYVAVK